MNCTKDITFDMRAAVRFFVNRRKARKEPVGQVKHSVPSVSFYDTVEECAIGDLSPDVRKAAASGFRALPYEVKHRLAFSPEDGVFCERAKFWSAILRPIMSRDQYSAAMIAILRWYRNIKTMQREGVKV